MKKIILFLIILVAFIVRLYRLNFPLADWHSWRQADTAAVSRNFIKFGFDLLHPRFDDLSKIPSGKDNPRGYRFVEFPIYNTIHAFLAKIFPVLSLEVWGRLLSIFCSLISLVFLYLITEKYLGWEQGLLAVFFFAILPFNVYYSRVILPEPMMVMTSLGMIYFTIKTLENYKLRIANLLGAIFFSIISFLLKPYTLVFIIPIFYLAWEKWHFNLLKWAILFLCLGVSLLPFLCWRIWMRQYPEGIPAYDWLLNEAGIRFKGAWFYWLFSDRVGRLILGDWGLIPFVLGIMVKTSKKGRWFFHFWLLAILAYFFIIAGGNVKHDYYQLMAIPIICIFLARGSYFLLVYPVKFLNKLLSCLLLVVSCLFMLAFSWYFIRDFFNINRPEIVEAGREVDKLVPKNAKVVAPYQGDTAFLYQTNRQGWPYWLDYSEINNYKPDYLVTVEIDQRVEELIINYCLVKRTPHWVIIDLTKTCFKQE